MVMSGRKRPGLGEDGRLLIEVAVLHHAGQLDDLSQLHFAPLAAHAGRTQRANEVLRFQLQLLLRVADQVEQRLHARAVVDARLFSTSFSFASTWTSVSLIGVTSEPSSCWRRVRSIAASRWTLPIF